MENSSRRHQRIAEEMQEPEPDPYMTQSDTEKETAFPIALKSQFDSFEFEHEVPDEYSSRERVSGLTFSIKVGSFLASNRGESQQNTLRDHETRFSDHIVPVTT